MATVTVRPAEMADVEFLAPRLRAADAAEVLALGCTPERALRGSLLFSDAAWMGIINGVPSMLFGVSGDLIANVGTVWGLGSDNCTKHPRVALVYGRIMVREMLELYPVLENYCDADYAASHRWLRKIGFTVGPPEPHGIKNHPFCKIKICKGDV